MTRAQHRSPGDWRPAGFTLIELLVVIAIIGVLAGMLVPSLAKAKAGSSRVKCLSNLKQASLSFGLWAQDNDGKYPWMVKVAQGGSQDAISDAYQQFMFLTNYLNNPQLLYCPSDRVVTLKSTWTDFYTNGDFSLSYFVGLCANETLPRTLLLGDRNISGLGLFSACTNSGGMIGRRVLATSYWSDEMHQKAGNIAFPDGSAERLTTVKLQSQAANSGSGSLCSDHHILGLCTSCFLANP
jgi:prepilin-type N-terminal cleavage/methylation domain-containing protein